MADTAAAPVPDPTSTHGFVGPYEVDENGVPYYKFPPWPQAPAGVTIVPFKAFKDAGIFVRDNGEDELDGMGIPTIALPVVHGEAGTGAKGAKKRRKAQAEKNAREGVKLTWYEQWEEMDKNAPVRPYDIRQTRGVRLEQAISDFQVGKQWNPQLQSVFDFFRQFLGIITNPNQTKPKQSADEPDISDDEDMADDPPAEAHIIDQDRDPWADHALMNRFLDDPEHAIKVYLSSFFSSKGLMWVPAKLRDGPILIGLFLHYLIKHRVLPESRRALERAHAIAELARAELPRTAEVGQSLSPEKFGTRCRDLLGFADKSNLGAGGYSWDDVPAAPEAIKPPPPEPVAVDIGVEAITAAIINPDTQPDEPMQVDINGHTVNVPAEVASAAIGSGWDETATTTAGWGSLGQAVDLPADVAPIGSGWGDDANVTVAPAWEEPDIGKYGPSAWGYVKGPNGEPSVLPEPEDWTVIASDKNTLGDYLGPTVDTAALAQQRAEHSTRRLVRVVPPNPGTSGPAAQLATLVLAPWPAPFSIDISPPEMLFDHGKPGEYDPSTDEISVFVRADAVDKLVPGFGLQAIWVQVIEKPKEGAKKKKKGKGASQGWWYIEAFRGTFVTYWTPDELESATTIS